MFVVKLLVWVMDLTIEHMAMFVVKSIVIQVNGQVYGSIISFQASVAGQTAGHIIPGQRCRADCGPHHSRAALPGRLRATSFQASVAGQTAGHQEVDGRLERRQAVTLLSEHVSVTHTLSSQKLELFYTVSGHHPDLFKCTLLKNVLMPGVKIVLCTFTFYQQSIC